MERQKKMRVMEKVVATVVDEVTITDVIEGPNALAPTAAQGGEGAADEPSASGGSRVQEVSPKGKPKPILPKKVQMTRPFGFLDDSGHHYWQRDQIVDNPVEIEMLIEHKCSDFKEV